MEFKHIENYLWTPIGTKPRQEKKLAEFCRENGVLCYLPLIKKAHSYEKRKLVEFFVPMFPGYIFCCLNDEKFKTITRQSSFACRIQVDEFDERQLIGELNDIRRFEELTKELEVMINPDITKGSKVTVVNGPLKGLQGIVEHRKDKIIISVNIDILGQSVSAEINASDLEPVEEQVLKLSE